MATISSPGLGSGLDVSSILTQLMSIEARPLTAINQKEAVYQAKISGLGTVLGAFSSLQTAAKALTTPESFLGFKATVKDTTLASATADEDAVAGKYALEVVKLAQAQIVNTAANPTIPPAGGTLTIQVGAGAAVGVTVDAGDTLADIAASINEDAALKTQLKASVVDNRLVLESLSTGATNTISVSSVELTAFNTANLQVARIAQDAEIKLNGISIVRSKNTIDDALTGVSISLLKANAGTTTELTIGRDGGGLRSAIEALVKAYNEVNKNIGDLTKVDPSSNKGSILTGDAALRTAQAQLRSIAATRPTNNADPLLTNLSQLGITSDRNGNLSFDAAKFNKYFSERPESVADLMAAYGKSFESLAKTLSGTDGLLKARIDGMNASVQDLGRRREALNTRLEQVEKRYRTQFTALDSLVSNLNKTSSFLTQQLANLPKAG